MKDKRFLFFVVGTFAFVMIFMFGRKAYGYVTNRVMESSESDKSGDTVIEGSESIEEKVEAVDKKMNEVLASDEYDKMSLPERSELVSDILLRFEQDGYITGLLYDEDSFMYSFEYIDGTLGGWRIKDFSMQDGLLPMN